MGRTPAWPTRDLLGHRVRSTPAATALVDARDGTTWRYAALHAAVDRTVADVEGTVPPSAGAGSEDRPRVGILASTTPAFVTALSVAWRLGAVAVPLATDRPTAEQQQRLDRLDLEFVFDPTGDGVGAADPGCPVESVDPQNRGERSVPSTDDPAVPGWQPDETALVLFTSGTTGRPKGVRLTHGNLVASATASAYRLGVSPADRWHACLPTNHMGGLAPIVRSTLAGTAVVLDGTFEAETTADAMARHDATGVSLVPTMLRRLLDAGWEPHDSLRFVLLGGAPASRDLLAACDRRDVPVYPTYGTTETASQIATATPADVRENPDTVGAPLLGASVTLVDPAEGTPVEAGATGEVVVDGPMVSPGYLDGDGDAHGEFGLHTGDLARRDDVGRLQIRGRLDDAIQTGGETVHPARVADALREVEGIADAAVVGVPDPEWGERVVALVVPAADADPDLSTLEATLRDRLAPYAVPKAMELATSLPRTDSGTVDRAAVRERFRGDGPEA